ncbi:hypothetical protein [Pseudonocardia sp. NPDC049154]|uniref:hypothetical protein n=1 Tax=Pseudonocardia sp. NPDC049154 TaxID=3155501 RepID=UPI0034060640
MLSAQNAQQHVDDLLGQATGTFRHPLVGYSGLVTSVLQQGQVASAGSVTAAAVEALAANSATALVTVATTVTNTQVTDGLQRFYRTAMGLQRAGGRWLASSADVIG